MIKISIARPEEAAELLDIYSKYIERTVSFEFPPPGVDAYRKHIIKVLKTYPFLTVRQNGKIAGFTYASAFRDRSAYERSVETTIYLAPDVLRQGIGRNLYNALFEILKTQGFVMAYACIVYPYKISTGFHERMGFKKCGLYNNCAYKDGKWLNVVMMEKEILPIIPGRYYPKPIPFAQMSPAFINELLEHYSS